MDWNPQSENKHPLPVFCHFSRRRCPCCNAPVRIAELIRDTGFDALIQIVVRQKNKAEDAYFSDLIKKCNEPSDKFEPMASDEPSDKADPTASDEPSSTSTGKQCSCVQGENLERRK